MLPKRENAKFLSEAEKRIKKLLSSLIDSIRKNSRVILMAATDLIDNDLFKHGRMDHKIEINKPDVM